MEADDRLALHPRRPGRDRRRLPRGPAGGRAADRAADRRGPSGDRAVADPDGRVPRLGRDDRPQPRDRLARGRGARRGRCRSATCPTCSATSPRCPRSCAGPGSATPSSGAASPRAIDRHALHVAVARRLGGRDRVPRRRLRQRRVPVRRSPTGSPTKLAGYVDASAPFYGDRSILAMYGTDHAVPSPAPRRRRRRGQRGRRRHRGPDRDAADYVRAFDAEVADPAPRSGDARAGPASSAPAPGRTC